MRLRPDESRRWYKRHAKPYLGRHHLVFGSRGAVASAASRGGSIASGASKSENVLIMSGLREIVASRRRRPVSVPTHRTYQAGTLGQVRDDEGRLPATFGVDLLAAPLGNPGVPCVSSTLNGGPQGDRS